jgi:hypothetical protein
MGLVTAALGAGMIRWVLRALHEMSRAAADPSAHIGSAFDWVGPRVLPFFAGGANGVGLALLAAVAAAFAWLLWRRRSRLFREDPLHGALTALAFFGLAGTYAYIFAAGGGDKAKLTYFAANLPVFLAWAVLTLHRAFGEAGGRRGLALDAAAAAALGRDRPFIRAKMLGAPELARRIGHPPPARRVPVRFEPGPGGPLVPLAAARFGDVLASFLEWLGLAGAPARDVAGRTGDARPAVEIRTASWTPDDAARTRAKLRSFARRFALAGFEWTVEPNRFRLACAAPDSRPR